MNIPKHLRSLLFTSAWFATAALTFGLGRLGSFVGTPRGPTPLKAAAGSRMPAAVEVARTDGGPHPFGGVSRPAATIEEVTGGRPFANWLTHVLEQDDEIARMTGFMLLLDTLNTPERIEEALAVVNTVNGFARGGRTSRETSMLLQKWTKIEPKSATAYVQGLVARSPAAQDTPPAPFNMDPITWIGGNSGNFSDPLNWSPNMVPGPANPVTIDRYAITEVILPGGTVSMGELNIPQGRVVFRGPPTIVDINGDVVVAAGVPDFATAGSQTLASLSISSGSTVTFKSTGTSSPPPSNSSVALSVPSGMSFTFKDLEGSLDIETGITFNTVQTRLENEGKLFNKGALSASDGLYIDGGIVESSTNQSANYSVYVLSGGATLNVAESTTLTLTGIFDQVSGSVVNQNGKGTVVLKGPQYHPSSSYNVPAGTLDSYVDLGKYTSNLILSIGVTTATLPNTGNLILRQTQHISNLRLFGKSVATVAANGLSDLAVNSLTIATNSKLHLNNNAMLVKYPNISPFTPLNSYIAAGRITGTNPDIEDSGNLLPGISEALDQWWVEPFVTYYGFNLLTDQTILINYVEDPGPGGINLLAPLVKQASPAQVPCPPGALDALSLPRYLDSGTPQFEGYYSATRQRFYSSACPMSENEAIISSSDPGFEFPHVSD